MANTPIVTPWSKSPAQVLKDLSSNEHGLSSTEAEHRISQYGLNELPDNEEHVTLLGVLIATITDKLPALLLVSALITAIFGLVYKDTDHFTEAIALAIILLVMAIANYFMEKSAESGVAALKKTLQKTCRVYRNGQIVEIETTQVTVGDVIILKEGDAVPADSRILHAVNATADEASLTGESMPSEKSAEAITADTELAHRSSMLFMGTYVTSGNVTAVVTSIALNTELGQIADQIAKAENTLTPLQKQLDQLGTWLLNGTLAVCSLVALVFLYRAYPEFKLLAAQVREVGFISSLPEIGKSFGVIADILNVSVSLAIAFIPEALSAVIILALRIGVVEMISAGAIVKNPKGAEALGSVTIFNSDKTGTLTTGTMSVVNFWTKANDLVTAEAVLKGNGIYDKIKYAMAYCNDVADATERALATFLVDAGYVIGEQTAKYRLAIIPFSSARKRMSVLVKNGETLLITKGAPDVVLDLCSNLQGATISEVKEVAEKLARQGYRVLAIAQRQAEGQNDLNESNLTLLGLVALIDPPRPEVIETIKTIKAAGVTPVMITGDAGATAETIARQIGILAPNSKAEQIMSGAQLNELIPNGDVSAASAEALAKVSNVRVFYRVSPTDKKTIVSAQQKLGQIVAMTGDGVNDAPALKQADIGVAMGDRATEVTKDVADIILKSGYTAIAAAIRVGRTILLRTRLYTHALLSTNMSEVGLFLLAIFVGWEAPLTSVMLLVINFLGDGWLSIALATEKSEKDVMTQKPRPSTEAVITPYMWTSIGLQGLLVTAILGWFFYYVGTYATTIGLDSENALKLQQSAVFAAFLVQKVARSSFTARSLKYNIWEIGFFSNGWTLLAGATTVAMGAFFLLVPPVTHFLGMTGLPVAFWPIIFGLGMVPPIFEEVVKYLRKK